MKYQSKLKAYQSKQFPSYGNSKVLPKVSWDLRIWTNLYKGDAVHAVKSPVDSFTQLNLKSKNKQVEKEDKDMKRHV